ncbi:MAG: hypothetical protein ACOYBM_04455 [Dethiobacteria bacterium]|jgi:hypothetical protein
METLLVSLLFIIISIFKQMGELAQKQRRSQLPRSPRPARRIPELLLDEEYFEKTPKTELEREGWRSDQAAAIKLLRKGGKNEPSQDKAALHPETQAVKERLTIKRKKEKPHNYAQKKYILEGIIWSEILGSPRSRFPYRSPYMKR